MDNDHIKSNTLGNGEPEATASVDVSEHQQDNSAVVTRPYLRWPLPTVIGLLVVAALIVATVRILRHSPSDQTADASAMSEESSIVIDDATAEPSDNELNDPLLRTIDRLRQRIPDVFSRAEGTDQDDLHQADAYLNRLKEENRRALRDVNRQVRLPGRRSPHVVLIAVNGLKRDDLACYGGKSPTPHLDALAEQGCRFDHYQIAGSASATLASLHSGHMTAESLRGPSPLARMMWQAGYTTVLEGDCRVGADAANGRGPLAFDLSFGIQGRETEELFPEVLYSNGRRLTLVENAEGKQKISLWSAVWDDCRRQLRRATARRPLFMMIQVSLEWARDEQQSAVEQLDHEVGRFAEALHARKLANNTMWIVASVGASTPAGMTEQGAEPQPIGAADTFWPLIISLPGQPRPSLVIRQQVWPADVLPTLADRVGALWRPETGGVSLVPLWQRNQEEMARKDSSPTKTISDPAVEATSLNEE